jgi:hypothetical protein
MGNRKELKVSLVLLLVVVLVTALQVNPSCQGEEQDTLKGKGTSLADIFRKSISESDKSGKPLDLRGKGKAIAMKFGQNATRELHRIAKGNGMIFNSHNLTKDRIRAQEIAIWALAFIGSRESTDAIMKCILDTSFVLRNKAFLAVFDAPEEQARRVARILASLKSPNLYYSHLREKILVLLRVFGSPKDLIEITVRLEEKDIIKRQRYKRQLEICAVNLRFKFENLERKRIPQYTRIEKVFWQAYLSTPNTRHIEGAFWNAAKKLRANVKGIPWDFVSRKLNVLSATPEEIATTACYCALTNERKAIPALRKIATIERDIPAYLKFLAEDIIKRIENSSLKKRREK